MFDDRSMNRAGASAVGGLWAIAALWLGISTSATAKDTVYVGAAHGSGGQTKWSGRILDYTGTELRLRIGAGQERKFPADQVLRIETEYTPQQVEADARFARRDFRSALDLYAGARTAESRLWVRRQITAQMVWCYRALGQAEAAAEEFLVLVRSDPPPDYFVCIPLAWVPSQPSPSLERKSQQWLSEEAMPAAMLLGASHLMSTGSRLRALETLRKLVTVSDRRIAFLALAQTWRAVVVTADEAQLADWTATIERMPEALRAGPYYVLGQGWAQRQSWEEAALAWLRVPVLYPEHRLLAAQALMQAGGAAEKLGQSQQAAGLYGELVRSYPETTLARDARARLHEIESPN